MAKTLSLLILLLTCAAFLPAQDMIFETYAGTVDFWLLLPYSQFVFPGDKSDTRYQVSVEIKGKGIKTRTLYNEQLEIPQREWLSEAAIPVRFSSALLPGTYNVSILIRNVKLGGKQSIKKQIRIGEMPTELGMAYVVSNKDGIDFIPSGLKKIPDDLSSCRILQKFTAEPDSVSVNLSGKRISLVKPGSSLDFDLMPWLERIRNEQLSLVFHEANVFYHLDPFLFSPWFSYGLRYSLKDQLAQIRYIATQDEWQVLRKVPSDKYSEVIEQYWTLHDPSPGTLRNEAREQFYQRVLIADERYSLHKKLKGWVSDRGRIYIKYGDPDEVSSESLPLNLHPYIIWYYYDENLEFIFADVGGFGQYQLRNKDEEY